MEVSEPTRVKRRHISGALRFATLAKCKFACHYCGAAAAETALVIDHVTPVTMGGLTEPDNLVAACEPCNDGKSSRDLSSVPPIPVGMLSPPIRVGRPPLNMKVLPVRLPHEIVAEIDARAGTYGRAQFIRDAVKEKLERGK